MIYKPTIFMICLIFVMMFAVAITKDLDYQEAKKREVMLQNDWIVARDTIKQALKEIEPKDSDLKHESNANEIMMRLKDKDLTVVKHAKSN